MALYSRQDYACSSGLSVYRTSKGQIFGSPTLEAYPMTFEKRKGSFHIRGMLQRYVQKYLRQQETAFRQRCRKALKTRVKRLAEVERMRVVSSNRIGLRIDRKYLTHINTSLYLDCKTMVLHGFDGKTMVTCRLSDNSQITMEILSSCGDCRNASCVGRLIANWSCVSKIRYTMVYPMAISREYDQSED